MPVVWSAVAHFTFTSRPDTASKLTVNETAAPSVADPPVTDTVGGSSSSSIDTDAAFTVKDPAVPVETGFHDRGPSNATSQGSGGSWSVYWYNGVIVNSEIARGMDIFELLPSDILTQNEIDAANSVVLTQLNSQGQPIFEWPATFALARAYLDQLERWHGMTAPQIASARAALAAAEGASGSARRDGLRSLAATLDGQSAGASDSAKVAKLIDAVQRLADAG